jgi:uncharacterized protein with gpF-like domain
MNKYQKRVQFQVLKNEAEVIKEITKTYEKALQDIMVKIADLQARTDTQNLQSIIYQVEYQKALKKQIETILDQLHTQNFQTISEYLTKCYEESWVGTLYDLQNQGIPLIFPIDQEQVVKAIQLNTKLSKNLYDSLGIEIKDLKRIIRSEISRGISQAYSYEQIASLIKNASQNTYNNSIRIARTEGHRISQESTYNAQAEAKKKGANIVKEWDSTLDGKTRPNHRFLDGQIVDIDKPFKNADGDEAMYPGGFGIPSEDINCRCVVLQRAKWNLGKSFTKMNGEDNELMEFKNKEDYEEFKKEFWRITNDKS